MSSEIIWFLVRPAIARDLFTRCPVHKSSSTIYNVVTFTPRTINSTHLTSSLNSHTAQPLLKSCIVEGSHIGLVWWYGSLCPCVATKSTVSGTPRSPQRDRLVNQLNSFPRRFTEWSA